MTASPASTRTTREPLEVVAPSAVATASILSKRVRGRDAQLRRTFIRRRRQSKPTPLMFMLRGGRGGEVRLKTYLSLLWVGVAAPHTVAYPARTWAALLGLPKPETLGARRVTDALTWLEANDFVLLETQKGGPTTVTLLEETGAGRRYTLPGARITALIEEDKPWGRHAYDKVPVDLWTKGWLAALNGPGLACLLVMLSASSAARNESNLWFSRSLLKETYDMSDDTRLRGMTALADFGLVQVGTESLARTSADFKRSRNTYRLVRERLAQGPLQS